MKKYLFALKNLNATALRSADAPNSNNAAEATEKQQKRETCRERKRGQDSRANRMEIHNNGLDSFSFRVSCQFQSWMKGHRSLRRPSESKSAGSRTRGVSGAPDQRKPGTLLMAGFTL